ncbi:hypothetical protein [Bradyrhizobium sp. CCGUVB14]|uniref:hypothetical protein n=1 Tax=Bradyrhizobium sp. CCGUVB14 TaxID=2949628 RepID=UPI0020B22F29|nr:hypothetical protein [Bradyrhizobium sp. CCGUVB14]MCP3441255.1 hypothetical protein [Bradyrhizobium sp. CCGUVB14]
MEDNLINSFADSRFISINLGNSWAVTRMDDAGLNAVSDSVISTEKVSAIT